MESLPPSTVLIIDDEPANLSIMSDILMDDYRVLVAGSGPLGLEIAASDPRPDIILLDIQMPEMDGYQVLGLLQSEAQTRDIPVIIVTALESGNDEGKGLSLGAVDYVTKPVDPIVLRARIKTQLTLKAARDLLHDQNAFLEAEVERRVAENQTIQDVSIRALAHLAETRDPETGAHILRTQNLVEILATKLAALPRFNQTIDEQFIRTVTKSAPLHDIGKVGIPDEILLKEGKLSANEWKTMKTHAALGAQAIEQAEQDIDGKVKFLETAKEIAHWHHERWDGSGYPDGLSGDAIPISARIMAIADVFDALLSPRVYKAAMSSDEAYRIIEAGRGTQFDPDMVDVLLRDYADFVAIGERYQR